MDMHTLIRTGPLKAMIVPRVLAGLPLVGLNLMHLTGAAPLRPILEGAGIPLPGLNAVVAPVFGLLAGLMLLSGGLARVGGVIAIGTMSAAVYTHLVHDWTDEPPVALPIVVMLAAAVVVWKGAGAWSVDRKMQEGKGASGVAV